jgi:16S rRNA (uracil1498-N3)-methyltransferase
VDRVFLKQFDGEWIRGEETAHQIRKVLRLGVGDTFLGTDGHREWTLRIEDAGRDSVRARVLAEREALPTGPRVTVAQALLKKQRWELFLEKMTELGAAEIVPVEAARCVARHGDDAADKKERWARIMERATAQCRGAMPVVREPLPLYAWIAQCDAPLRLACIAGEDSVPIVTAMKEAETAEHVAVLVGPEGDFTPEEVAAIRAAGFRAVSLGPLVLRAETAAMVALAAVMLYSEQERMEP